jgi:hypothetical protein
VARTDVRAASNARLVPEVVYERDPRGLGMFRRLARVNQRGVSGTATAPVVERNGWWHGRIHVSPQRFVGLAHIGTGATRAYVKSTPELTDGRSAGLADPAQRLFAAKAARRQR